MRTKKKLIEKKITLNSLPMMNLNANSGALIKKPRMTLVLCHDNLFDKRDDPKPSMQSKNDKET